MQIDVNINVNKLQPQERENVLLIAPIGVSAKPAELFVLNTDDPEAVAGIDPEPDPMSGIEPEPMPGTEPDPDPIGAEPDPMLGTGTEPVPDPMPGGELETGVDPEVELDEGYTQLAELGLALTSVAAPPKLQLVDTGFFW